jgi:hypothetical protein
VNQSFHLDGPTILMGGVSIANVCLLLTAAFFREGASVDGAHSTLRMKLGFVAVSLGLCSQVLYCLMLVALNFDWVPPSPGNSINHLEISLSRMGLLLSATTLFAALFGRGLRRNVGLWVSVTTWFLWGLSSLGASLRSL